MANSTQSYQNHTRWLPPFHFFLLPILLINLVFRIRAVYLVPAFTTAWSVVMAIALITLAVMARAMVVSVQDRVIRLEMRLRLQEILPAELKAKIRELTPRQLVCLRFAGDDEMPELVREVLAGNLASSKAIKARVKNWQPDWMRA